jgi:Uncharacterised protein family (UPF0236)
MEPARSVGRVFSPLDEEPGLVAGTLAPRQHEHLVHLSSYLPFAQSAKMLERLLGVQVSKETTRRLTEQAGGEVEAAQTEEAGIPFQEDPANQNKPTQLAMSADGALVPLAKGEWAEVRTLAIGEVKAPCPRDGEHEQRVGKLSYFSRLTTAETFTELAEGEMRRRKIIQAEQVCAVTDGADWLQPFFDVHRPDALRILDFPHAAEHLAKLLEGVERAGLHFPPQMLKRCLHILKHRGPSLLLRMADRLPKEVSEQDGIREHLGYLRKREALMQYPLFQQQGWPIGSGMVESANKLVVEARLKGAGMHWERKNVNPMLALRNGVCNQRWQETWQVARSQARKREALRRSKRTARRIEARLLLHNPALLTSPALPPHPPRQPPSLSVVSPPSAPAATLPGSSRPSAHHPWKKQPACRPKAFAKN